MTTSRILPTYYLLEQLYLDQSGSNLTKIQPRELDRTFLYQAHDRDYIDVFEELSQAGFGEAMEYGLGSRDCPIWKGMADVSEFVVASTVTAAEDIYHDRLNYGFVLLGGLHHARARLASGFCYYNDINVAIHRLKALDKDIRILYVDTDLHHGDGVQFDFYHDPNVLTVSFHESGQFLFPGTGFPEEIGTGDGEGTSINMPFYPYTWDGSYRKMFDDIVPVVFESYQPDYVIWQAGSDAHIRDPLGHLMLTSSTYHHLGSTLRKLSIENMDSPKVLTLGGGGYNPYGNAKSWTNALSGLANIELPEQAPQSWIDICQKNGITVDAALQEPESHPMAVDQRAIEEGNKHSRIQLSEVIEPYFDL